MLRAQLTSAAALAGWLRFNSSRTISCISNSLRLVSSSFLRRHHRFKHKCHERVSRITCDQVRPMEDEAAKTAARPRAAIITPAHNVHNDLQNVEAMADKVEFYCENQNNWAVPECRQSERLSTSK